MKNLEDIFKNRYNTSSKEVQKDIDLMPYKIVKGGSSSVKVNMGEKDYSAEEISAMILSKLKLMQKSTLAKKLLKQ